MYKNSSYLHEDIVCLYHKKSEKVKSLLPIEEKTIFDEKIGKLKQPASYDNTLSLIHIWSAPTACPCSLCFFFSALHFRNFTFYMRQYGFHLSGGYWESDRSYG